MSAGALPDLHRIDRLVNAVLYEGYILWPYRASATKNRSRWTFGGIYPRAWHEATGADPCGIETQCLIEGDGTTRIAVRLRFLQPIAREVGKLPTPLDTWPEENEPAFERVPSLTVGAKTFYPWQEAMEREVKVADCTLGTLIEDDVQRDFAFEAGRELETLKNDAGGIEGVLCRESAAVHGACRVAAEIVAKNAYRIAILVENRTAMEPTNATDRERASLYSFASAHLLLGTAGGAFVSLTDPPENLQDAAAACANDGLWPVLVGEPGARDLLLVSPIILSDYPEVAPESPGDLYDATEIDELLSLNILAMTDAEKREMAATDPRAAALLARTEQMTGDDFMRLHGTLRVPRPVSGLGTGDWGLEREDNSRERHVADNNLTPSPPGGEGWGEGFAASKPLSNVGSGVPRLALYRDGEKSLQVGTRVRLHPKAGGDIMDLALAGKTAVIEAIERDFEDRIHVSVCLDDDPGREWGLERMPGHRFFFSPQELEALPEEARA
jgi:hypothetical protein